jgi:hypothetical protein
MLVQCAAVKKKKLSLRHPAGEHGIIIPFKW